MSLELMKKFTTPKGINFSHKEDTSAANLVNALCKTVSFLQAIEPYIKFERYDDWWEHDGLHFWKDTINFNDLFSIVNSPMSLLKSMPGDFDVFIGVAPQDNSWYLRFYLDWDDDGFNMIGRFDITLPRKLSETYREEVLKDLSVNIEEKDSDSYYNSIISLS